LLVQFVCQISWQVEKSWGSLSSSQHWAIESWLFVMTMMIFPVVSVHSTWVHHELHKRSFLMVMSSLLLLIIMDMYVSKVVLLMPLMGMEAPFVRNLLFFWRMFLYITSPRIV